jgi:hypothetical protein
MNARTRTVLRVVQPLAGREDPNPLSVAPPLLVAPVVR